jgi:hypothetical protein
MGLSGPLRASRRQGPEPFGLELMAERLVEGLRSRLRTSYAAAGAMTVEVWHLKRIML